MATLELECPSCRELLELDAGFAGGVCRCSNCGTLMTVPADGAAAEALQRGRPERPDAPGDPPPPARSQRPDRPAAPGAARQPPAAPEETSDAPASAGAPVAAGGDAVYTTASGRTVHVGNARIPTAHKRKRVAVRALTAAIIALVLLLILGASVGVLIMAVSEGPLADPAAPPPAEPFVYARDANPYQHDHANVLGLPLSARAAVVVDASAASQPWLAQVNEALRAGLLDNETGTEVALLYETGRNRHLHPTNPAPLVNWQRRDLVAFHAGIAAEGDANLAAAIGRALNWGPAQVILITGRRPPGEAVAAMRSALNDRPDVLFDVVTIDEDVPVLDDLAGEFLGRYVLMSTNRLAEWKAEAQGDTGEEQ